MEHREEERITEPQMVEPGLEPGTKPEGEIEPETEEIQQEHEWKLEI